MEYSNCLWLPKERFTPDIRDELTLNVFKLDGTTETVECFRRDRRGYVGVPRVFGWGLKSISLEDLDIQTSSGFEVSFPQKVKLRDYQKPFVADMLRVQEDYPDFVAKAATGKGKTVMGLAFAQALGRSTVVVVDQENLMDQWVERIHQHLGLLPTEVGIVQGKRADWEGKPIVICMIHTLVRKQMPEEFYDNFGTAIFDECHTAGAPTFSRALMMFSAEVRVGLSATPKRKDALQKMVSWNLGEVAVELEAELGRSAVYVLESEGVYSWRSNNSKMTGAFVSEIAADGRRNLALAEATRWLYETGRDVLVIGDRVEHLCSLMALTEALGVPAEDMGMYAKARTVPVYEKDPRPPRRPEGWVRGTAYTPVRLVLAQKTIPKKVREAVLENARIVYATYGVMAKGVDAPRLSAGVDATPRSEATQVLGRLLRTMGGKLKPIWVTLADVNSFRSLYQLTKRLSDYESSNAEIFLWDPMRGRKRLDTKAYRKELESRISLLRQSQIITSLDGNSTLVTPSTQHGRRS